MNCWKTININRQYGKEKLMFISLTTIIASFLFLYLLLSMFIQPAQFSEYGWITLVISSFLLLPIHKLLHCIPLWLCQKKASIKIRFQKDDLAIYCSIPCALSRRLSAIAVLFPVSCITTTSIVASLVWPQHMHYFIILASINFGMSVYDFIYATQIMKAPKDAFIEDRADSFSILINRIA